MLYALLRCAEVVGPQDVVGGKRSVLPVVDGLAEHSALTMAVRAHLEQTGSRLSLVTDPNFASTRNARAISLYFFKGASSLSVTRPTLRARRHDCSSAHLHRSEQNLTRARLALNIKNKQRRPPHRKIVLERIAIGASRPPRRSAQDHRRHRRSARCAGDDFEQAQDRLRGACVWHGAAGSGPPAQPSCSSSRRARHS